MVQELAQTDLIVTKWSIADVPSEMWTIVEMVKTMMVGEEPVATVVRVVLVADMKQINVIGAMWNERLELAHFLVMVVLASASISREVVKRTIVDAKGFES